MNLSIRNLHFPKALIAAGAGIVITGGACLTNAIRYQTDSKYRHDVDTITVTYNHFDKDRYMADLEKANSTEGMTYYEALKAKVNRRTGYLTNNYINPEDYSIRSQQEFACNNKGLKHEVNTNPFAALGLIGLGAGVALLGAKSLNDRKSHDIKKTLEFQEKLDKDTVKIINSFREIGYMPNLETIQKIDKGEMGDKEKLYEFAENLKTIDKECRGHELYYNNFILEDEDYCKIDKGVSLDTRIWESVL